MAGVIVFTDFNGLYGQDAHEYLRYGKALFSFLKEGTEPGYFHWTAGYPLAGALLAFITGIKIAMLAIPVLSASWILVLVASFLIGEFPGREREVGVFAFLFLGLSPYFFRHAISVMSDVPALALVVTAYYFADRSIKLKKTSFFLFSVFTAFTAIFFRMALTPIVIPLIVFFVSSNFYKFNIKKLVGTLLLMAIPLLIHLYFKNPESTSILYNYDSEGWSLSNLFKRNFITNDGSVHYILPNLIYNLSVLVHPGFIFPGIIFIFLMFFNKSQPSLIFKPVLIGCVLYFLVVCITPMHNPRFLLPILPFFVIACLPSYLTLLSWFHYRRKLFYVFLTIVFCFQITLVYFAFLPFLKLNREEKKLALMVLKQEPKIIYTFGIDGALRSYGFDGKLINLFNQPLDSVTTDSYLIFNKKAFEKQWQGLNPMNNYIYLLNSGMAKLVEKSNDGWELYEIDEKYRHSDTGISPIN